MTVLPAKRRIRVSCSPFGAVSERCTATLAHLPGYKNAPATECADNLSSLLPDPDTSCAVIPSVLQPERAKIVIRELTPIYGANSRSVLKDLGFTNDEIDAMIAAGSAAVSWSEKYLPE